MGRSNLCGCRKAVGDNENSVRVFVGMGGPYMRQKSTSKKKKGAGVFPGPLAFTKSRLGWMRPWSSDQLLICRAARTHRSLSSGEFTDRTTMCPVDCATCGISSRAKPAPRVDQKFPLPKAQRTAFLQKTPHPSCFGSSARHYLTARRIQGVTRMSALVY